MSDDEIPVEARQNEYANLSDRQLEALAYDADQADDWQALSKIQVANRAVGEVPGGFTYREQSDFIDRR